VGEANRVETGMVFRVDHGAVHVGDLVVTRVFRDRSLARFVPDAMQACAVEPASRARAERAPDARRWTLEAKLRADSFHAGGQHWGFRLDESGAGVRWVDSPEKNRRLRLPEEVVARFRSVCEDIRFDELRNEYSYDIADGKPFPIRAFDAPSLTIRLSHGEKSRRVSVYAPWSIAEEPAHPDREHARRILRLWKTMTEVIHPPPIERRLSNIRALVAGVDHGGHEVVLSAGRYDGVARGMRFYLSRENTFIAEVEVVRVEMHRSAAGVVIVRPGQEIEAGDMAETRW